MQTIILYHEVSALNGIFIITCHIPKEEKLYSSLRQVAGHLFHFQELSYYTTNLLDDWTSKNKDFQGIEWENCFSMSEALSFFTKPAGNLFQHRPIELLAFKATLKEDINIQETTPQTLLPGYIFKKNKSLSWWTTPATKVKVSKLVVKKLTTSVLSPFSCPLFCCFGKFTSKKVHFFGC